MVETPSPPPPPGAPPPAIPRPPFDAEPRRAPGGCGRPVMIGCTAMLVLLGIAAIVFVVKAGAIFGWTMNQLREQVVANLPADVTPEERERLERGFAAAVERVRSGEVELPALKAMQLQLQSASTRAPRGELTREDVLDLLSTLERVGGLLPLPDAGEAPPGESEAAAPPAADTP